MHPAETMLAELATAFEHKNEAAARAHLLDGWSGSRFWTQWTDSQWREAATALRGATLKSAHDGERIYLVADEGRTKEIHVQRADGTWRLDYNSFKGPFPHEH